MPFFDTFTAKNQGEDRRPGGLAGPRWPRMATHRMNDEGRILRRPKKVLVIDVGGTHVKILMTGKRVLRTVNSGPTMTARKMVDAVKGLTIDWS